MAADANERDSDEDVAEDPIPGIDYDIPGVTDEDYAERVEDDDGGTHVEYPNGDW